MGRLLVGIGPVAFHHVTSDRRAPASTRDHPGAERQPVPVAALIELPRREDGRRFAKTGQSLSPRSPQATEPPEEIDVLEGSAAFVVALERVEVTVPKVRQPRLQAGRPAN